MIDIKTVKIVLASTFDSLHASRCYYDEAPKDAAFPYAVIRNVRVTSLAAGENVAFTVAFYTDTTKPNAAIDLEALLDIYRNGADGAIITDGNTFSGHINFDSQDDGSLDAEYDLGNRQQTYSARVFFY